MEYRNIEDECYKVKLEDEQFTGLIGNKIDWKANLIQGISKGNERKEENAAGGYYGSGGYSGGYGGVGYNQGGPFGGIYNQGVFGRDCNQGGYGPQGSGNYQSGYTGGGIGYGWKYNQSGYCGGGCSQTGYINEGYSLGGMGGYNQGVYGGNRYAQVGYGDGADVSGGYPFGSGYSYGGNAGKEYVSEDREGKNRGEKKGLVGSLIGELLGGGGRHNDDRYNGGNEHNKKKKPGKFSDQIGGYIGGLIRGGNGGGRPSSGGKSGGISASDFAGIIGGLAGPGSKSDKISELISGIGGLINKNGRYDNGGPNVNPINLNGGMVDVVSGLVGQLAHRYLNVDPTTGRIIGSIAGNLIFNLGGRDNKLGNVGKVVLDNIVSGKFRRKVDPYVSPEPTPRPTSPTPSRKLHEGVDFYTERDRCLREQQLFEDPQFPANDRSLFYSRSPPKYIEWKRPGEIIEHPQLIYEGQSRFDVVQGELGDCWLLAAAANLTLRDELFYRVVPPDQSFTENYAGIFHFQFWHYGVWVDVVVDDRLPTSNGELLYMHSRDHNEFWSALLEKAYAKLHGSYEALKGGTTSEALEDFTGGITEFFDLSNPPNHLMEMMMRGMEMGSLMGCSIEADPHIWEARMSNGLVRGHAYSITGMRMVDGPLGRTAILRIRNPWGNSQEWNGAWSDNSREWRYVPQNVRNDMGLVFAHDGEFWISFNDFMRNFEKMEICNLGPEIMDEISQMTGVRVPHQKWATNCFDGAWIANQTAGGCRNFIGTFAQNPQFYIALTDSDPDDDDDLCTVIIAVLQKYRRELKAEGFENLAIGFALYHVDEVTSIRGPLTTEYFKTHKACARSAAFINLREITGRFRLPPGNYVIVPSTYDPNEEAEFLLRVYTNGYIHSRQL